jgi:ribonucrease Y
MEIVAILISILISGVIFFVAGLFFGRFLLNRVGTTMMLEAESRRVQILQDAQKEAEAHKSAKVEEVNEEWKRKKREFEQEVTIKNNKFTQLQKQVKVKEDAVTKRVEQTQKREKSLDDQQKDINNKLQFIKERTEELSRLFEEENKRLEALSQLNADDAKAMLMENMLSKAKKDAAEQIRQIEEESKTLAQRKAEEIILSAIQRTSLDQAAENAITTIHLQSDELKGRIIGREGRNIKAFENITGVDIIVDDTPEVVILSCFDPVRRELAKMTLQKLLVDGVIHPGAIEKAYGMSQKELDEVIISTGEEAVVQLGIGNLHPDLMKLVGKMRFRSSYGQNMLKHAKEVAMLAGLMAAELKLDVKLAKRAGLLLDIGQMLDQPETTAASAGAELLKKYKEHAIVINAVAAQHGESKKEHAIADLVEAADTISSSRPGARGAVTPDGYIKRLESLEEIAKTFSGVAKTYALQAGREIRVIVEGERVNDAQAEVLAKDIAQKINESVQYPGQIKITVVRETRSTAYAR